MSNSLFSPTGQVAALGFDSFRKVALAALFAIGCSFGPVAGAQTYDAAASFSSSVNTNSSTWSYRYNPDLSLDGSYPLLETLVTSSPSWSPVSPIAWTLSGDLPLVFSNQSGGDLTFLGPPFTLTPGTLGFHPGPSSLAVISFLSPTAALYNLSFAFTDLDPNGGDGVSWAVQINSEAVLLASGAFGNGSGSGARSVGGLSLAAGDRVHFIVAPGTGGDFTFDSTELDATFSVIPEPSAASALAGLAALAASARRRKR